MRAERPRVRKQPITYALPLFAAWTLVGMIFFFPGLWKLRESGIAWIASDNLRNQMYWKWAQADFVPALRVDRSPLLCRIGAGLVVAFELSFPFLLPFRRLRPIAACGAWLFHLATAVFLKVSFASLAVSYVMFFDWRRMAQALGEGLCCKRAQRARPAAASPPRP